MVLPFDETKALKGEEPPDNLSLADRMCYIALVYIYSKYRLGKTSRENAQSEKAQILRQYAELKSDEEFISREKIKLQNRIAEASERYKNEPTTENADKLYAALWNINDKWREGD